MTTSAHIEALLFWKNEAVSTKWLAKTLEKSNEEITFALAELRECLKNRGITLIENGEEVALKTNPEASTLIDKLSKDELVKELTPSALETLTIILYRSPISKKEIDYIRGVNSGFILRNLLIRGLIQKESVETGRTTTYQPSLDLLSLLGISNIQELEGYENVKNEIEEFKNAVPAHENI
jgi:segregation and condensation protein B